MFKALFFVEYILSGCTFLPTRVFVVLYVTRHVLNQPSEKLKIAAQTIAE